LQPKLPAILYSQVFKLLASHLNSSKIGYNKAENLLILTPQEILIVRLFKKLRLNDSVCKLYRCKESDQYKSSN
jgi:hypothetical protein